LCTCQVYSSDALSVWVVVAVIVVVVVVVVAVATTSGGRTLMFITVHTGTYFNYLKSETVLYIYIGKFNSHLTESNPSVLQKSVS